MALFSGILAFLLLAITSPDVFGQKSVSFCAVGDVLLDRGCRTMTRRHGTGYLFERVGNFIRMQDLAFANLEGPLSPRGKPIAKEINFRADSAFVEVLKRPGLDVLSLANNHMLDYGRDALLDTRRILRENGFMVMGAGKDSIEASQPAIVEMNGLRLGFLAYVTVPQVGIRYRGDLPGPAFPDTTVLSGELARLRKAVDFMIVSFHWGTEYVPRPGNEQVALARFCIDHGADLILGHHPHVLQSIEKYRGKFILYSLGNFVFDQHKPVQRESMIFGCRFTERGVESPYIYPVELPFWTFRPVFPDCPANIRIGNRLQKISEGFGVKFREGDAVIFLE
jgi:poly-gamma-glutamate synthesis protein (capsule biosynthesis protein)